ncbi:hypothetical protein BGZ99_001454 [Dissophora globulifera]|uniref:Uncharacterized protein n=1 Tax=Dissophora globulifera TaxID=979702 RepID=A0A9P6RRG9_9FUNG|nr:hypothetical protein BGZ99_001454 [Dissophora globulifera]
MTISSKVFLTLGLTLALVSSTSMSLGLSMVEAATASAAAVPVAQEDTVDYSQYESPPIWKEVQTNDEHDLPINFQRGGARGGGDIHGRRRRSVGEKRAVIYDKDAHLSLDADFGDINFVNAQVEPSIPGGAWFKKRSLKKRSEDGFDDINEDAVDDYSLSAAVEFEVQREDEEEVEVDYSADTIFEQISDNEDESGEQADEDSEDNEDDEADDDEDEEEEEEEEEGEDEGGFNYVDEDVDLNEERRLDNEAGLQDWIEEMKSDEYFDLAGHPDGNGLNDIQEDQDQDSREMNIVIDEDEPSPSEEEIFAASWHN